MADVVKTTSDILTDAARMYPSYTTSQLKAAAPSADPATRAKMETEIAARESGASQQRVTPQIEGGKPMAKIGRM
jgi:hypothetical protein